MRHGLALLLGLLTGLLGGCFPADAVRSTSWMGRWSALQGPTGPNVVQMEVALLERPVGDAILNRDIWTLADEQGVALERRSVVEANGFRIGQLGGIPPAGLQALLTSERSCINPRRLQRQAGKETTLILGPTLPQFAFGLQRDGDEDLVELEQAQCQLLVVPSLLPDGRIRLHCTPQIRHGESSLVLRTTADQGGVLVQEERPLESYPFLSWEVTLMPNEYVVIGGHFDRPDTFGHRCFVRPTEASPVQRLLVIRTGRSLPEVADAAEAESLRRTPPVALQASGPAVPVRAP